jgi:signal transduction histidine kinase/DNA-binding response OmpR family regulator
MDDRERVNILLVDDRPENLKVLETVLSDLRENLVKARSGKEALRHLLAQEFAVILLDVNMPGMDGFETAGLIRQRSKTAHTPIIFLTAFDTQLHQAKGYSLGAVDYIVTPVVPENLRAKVGVFVELWKKNEQVRRQAEQLQEHSGQLRRLSETSLAINGSITSGNMLQVISEQARELLNAHQAATITNLDQKEPERRAAVSLSEKYGSWNPEKSGGNGSSFFALALAMERPLRMSQRELEAHPAWRNLKGNVEWRLPLRGWLSAPLRGQDGRTMGLLQVSDRRQGDFTEEDESLLVHLSQVASIAIENGLYLDAREANRLKDEFLATLSHELRTPLNAILGWTHLLRTGELDRSSTALGLEVIERNVKAQSQLIEDLLDVSRIIAGKMRLKVQPVDLEKVIDTAVNAARPSAQAKEIEIQCQLDPAGCRISADPDRLQQVIWNLLANAVKFTPRGGRVEVVLQRRDQEVEIEVRDNGMGIQADFLPYIFDRFRQFDASSTRPHGGLGLGLGIVRHLVELHGGTVRADSKGAGKGSTFVVTLPMAAPVPENGKGLDPDHDGRAVLSELKDLRGLRILLVEDETDSRLLLAKILEKLGAGVEAVASVREALRAMERIKPDILVSDISMPDEDGYTLIQTVRARSPEAGGGVPAVALTAYAREEDRVRALAAGFQKHVPKPVEPTELVAVIAGLVDRNGGKSG